MRKKIIIILVLLALIGSAITVVTIRHQKEVELAESVRLEIAYYNQNEAFEMDCNGEERRHYLDAQKSRLNVLAVDLHVYNHIQNKYRLTVDEVLNYLNEEYNSDGKLRVYSRPENIEDYINIYPEVQEMAVEFGDHFNDYMKAQGYTVYFYRQLSYEEVVSALEKYINDDKYDPPHKEENETTSGVEFTPELLNKIYLKKKEMEEDGRSEEEIDEAINQIIDEYKDFN
jgi:hypothetical protein